MAKKLQKTPSGLQATDSGEKDTAGKGKSHIYYKKGDDEYDGSITLNETFIEIEMKIIMTPYFWKVKLTIDDLCAFDENWGSFRKIGEIFEFMAETFTIKENIDLEVNRDTKVLKISFKFMIGLKEKTLTFSIKNSDPDIATTAKSQGEYIRKLFETRSELTDKLNNIRKELDQARQQLLHPKTFVLALKSNGNSSSTYDAAFTDIPGISEEIISLKKNSKIVWSLNINGLHFYNASNYKASFRLKLTGADNVNKYWPIESGTSFTLAGTTGGSYILPFNFKDMTELNKGDYKVKIQWAYNSGSNKYLMQYVPIYGDIKLIIEIY